MKAVAIWFVLSALVFSDFIQITVAESPEGVKEGESHENAGELKTSLHGLVSSI